MSSCCSHNTMIRIEAGPHNRQNAVVTLDCEPGCVGVHTLTDQDSGEQIPAQCFDGQVTFIVPQMVAGQGSPSLSPRW